MTDNKYNYCQNEIDSMEAPPEGYSYKIQIHNSFGDHTNWMNITPEQLAKIREILGERE